MYNSWLVTIPPLLVLAVALWSRNIIIAFFTGIIAAALVVADFNPINTLLVIWAHTLSTITDIDNIYVYAFLILMGVIVSLLSFTGAATAFGDKVASHITSPRKAEQSTLFFSVLLFLDDYLNSLTVGYVMHPLTDKFKIPRVKLAFIIHSMAAPLAMIIPISSWLAWIIRQIALSGISLDPTENPIIVADPFYVYIKSIPYIFYSFLMIAITLFIIQRRISFGPMAIQEEIAESTGNLFGGRKPIGHILQQGPLTNNASLFDFLFPIITLVGCTVLGILYTGGYWMLGGPNTLIETFQNTKILPILFYACTITLGLSISLFLYHKKLTLSQVPDIFAKGVQVMGLAVVMVFFAGIFAELLREDLQTGQYVAGLLVNHFSVQFLPLILFVVSSLIAICTGSSWGTMAIMTPFAVPFLLKLLHLDAQVDVDTICLLFPCLGAVFSGSVAGDHISPISETTIMATTSSGCHMMDHVYTQLPYGAIALVSTGISFLVVGLMPCTNYWLSVGVSMGTGLAVSFISLVLFNKMWKSKAS